METILHDHMNRIKQLFHTSKGNLLSVYYTAGFPQPDDTVTIGKALADAGADLIEIGIPFSDPVADGPVIQASNKKALDNGMNVRLLLKQVKELRSSVTIPIILMGYLNPVFQFGIDAFCEASAEAGVDGLILPDLPVAEYEHHYKEKLAEHGLLNTFLISPTTSEARIRHIDQLSDGFIYAVSASSTTGARTGFTPDQVAYFERLKSMQLKNPFLIGFGISNHETFKSACEHGAGAIVGSAFITMLEHSKDLTQDIRGFVNGLKTKG